MGPQIGDRIGRYVLDSVLGVGGMGVVFTATDTALDRKVALKVMSGAIAHDPEFRTRFQREAATLARLDSPHVIAIHDHGEHVTGDQRVDGPGGAPYLVTQLVPGGELGQLITERGVLPPRLAAQVCAQIAGALDDAHRVGVIHRDVKPANVLLRDAEAAARGEPHAYLCDFGIAQTDGAGLTQAGGIAGTWGYLAPERGLGSPATPASDIYSVGCLLWACLTGGPPYRGSDVEVALAHQNHAIPQLVEDTDLARGINRVLAGSMAKDPARRYPSAAALRADLAALDRPGASGIGVAPDPTSYGAPATAAAPRRRGRVVLASVAALVLLAAAATGAVLLTGDDGGPATADPFPPIELGGETGGTDGETDAAEAGPRPGDFDGDGLGDLMVQTIANDPDATRLLWTSDGGSFSAEPEERPFVDPSASGVPARGDFDGDGTADLLLFGAGGALEVEYADGESSVTEATALRGTFFPSIADFDGDGRDDLGIVSFPEEEPAFFLSLATDDGLAEPEEVALPDDLPMSRLEAGDFDGDGEAELIAITGSSSALGAGDVSVLEMGEDAWEYVGEDLPLRGIVFDDGLEIVQGDFDGDGAAEIAVEQLGASNRRIRVADIEITDGEATLTQRRWFAGERSLDDNEDQRVLRPSVADVDGDGDEDIVLFRRVNDGVSFETYLSNGETFAAAGSWGTWDCDTACQDEFIPVDRNAI